MKLIENQSELTVKFSQPQQELQVNSDEAEDAIKNLT